MFLRVCRFAKLFRKTRLFCKDFANWSLPSKTVPLPLEPKNPAYARQGSLKSD
jgi:hypothetical protein